MAREADTQTMLNPTQKRGLLAAFYVRPFEPVVEQEFEEDFCNRNLEPQSRSLLGLVIITVIWGVFHWFLPPHQRDVNLVIHYLFLCPSLIIIYRLICDKKYRQWSQILICLGVFIYAATFMAMEFVAPTVPNSEASRTTVILILIVMASAAVVRTRFICTVVCCYSIWAMYAILCFTLYKMPSAVWNVGILLAACALGHLFAMVNERAVREEFKLRRQIEEKNSELAASSERQEVLASLRMEAIVFADHELSNMLSPIILAIDAALIGVNQRDTEIDYRARMKDAVDQARSAARLLKVMLNVARLTKGESVFNSVPDFVNLEAFISDIVERERRANQNKSIVKRESGNKLPAIALEIRTQQEQAYVYYSALYVIVSNILNNAVKYSSQGGTINITAYEDETSIHISVKDEGIGIASDRLDKIFDTPFDRGKAQLLKIDGIGIGLGYIKNLVKEQGGAIWAESPGEWFGSTFFVELPIINP